MKSLFITRWRPHNPDGGAQLRNAQNIAAMAELGPVDVLSIGRPETVEPVPGINSWQHFEHLPVSRRFAGDWLFRPGFHPHVALYQHPGAEAALAAMLAKETYDVVIVEEIWLASYLRPLKEAGVVTVLDTHNVEAVLRHEIEAGDLGLGPVGRLRSWLFSQRLTAIEKQAVRCADHIWACSGFDAQALDQAYRPKGRLNVVPNAIDVAAYASARAAQAQPVPPDAPVRLLYVGTFSYPPNEVAALSLINDILPVLREEVGGVALVLVGREPTPAMMAAAQGHDDIEITGGVASVQPYLAQPCLMPMPIHQGGGTRLKALEAFAACAAVIATPKAIEGIAYTHGETIRIAETSTAFVQEIRALWDAPAARHAQTEAAFKLVDASYSWPAIARTVREILQPETVPG